MAKKKKKQVVIASQQDTAQAREVLDRYHQIAGELRKSASRKQAEEALGAINALPEAAQVALAKELSREQQTDAADLLVAINELASQKDARKEAKRSLIQLESQRIYSNWEPPAEERIDSLVPAAASYRRFWKGMVTDTLDIGTVQLVLSWEQGTGYRRVLAFIFALNFEDNGVQEFVMLQDERKDDFEATAGRVAKSLGASFVDCSPARGRSLLKKALEINEQTGARLPSNYQRNLPLIKQLVLEAPGIEDEDVEIDLNYLEDADADEMEEVPDLTGLDPVGVVTAFIEYWADDDFETAYRLLASDSPICEGLSEEEWSEQRDTWAAAHDTGDLQPGFAEERASPKPKLWLPRMMGAEGDKNIKVVEAGWSLELEDKAFDEEQIEQDQEEMEENGIAETPIELPTASAVFQETGRHWFLATYTLVKDQGEWRIQSITDEVAVLRQLSDAELKARVDGINQELNRYTQKHHFASNKQWSDEKTIAVLQGMLTRMYRLSYVVDALIARDAEVDLLTVQSMAGVLSLVDAYERSLFYMNYIALHSEEKRLSNLRATATMRQLLSRVYDDKGYEEQAMRFREKAEQEYNELLAIEEDGGLHISLAELLLDDERPVEAEDHLLLAKEMVTDTKEMAHIEMHLGEIALDRGSLEEGLAHYQRVSELVPDEAESWVDLAKAYYELDNLEEAEKHFRHAIEIDAHDPGVYRDFSDMFQKLQDYEKAIEILEQGQEANPDSVDLIVMLVTLYLQQEDIAGLERTIKRLASLDPKYPALPIAKAVLALLKSTPRQRRSKAGMPPMLLPPMPERPKKRR